MKSRKVWSQTSQNPTIEVLSCQLILERSDIIKLSHLRAQKALVCDSSDRTWICCRVFLDGTSMVLQRLHRWHGEWLQKLQNRDIPGEHQLSRGSHHFNFTRTYGRYM